MEIDNSNDITITRSFRIYENWDRLLFEEAERKGVTVSSILTQLVRKYLVIDKFQESQQIVMPKEIFIQCLELTPIEQFHDLAKYCKSMMISEILKRGMSLQLESYIWVLREILGRYYGWYRVNVNDIDNQTVLHFQHELNTKWSLFLKIVFESFIYDLNLSAIIETDAYSLTIKYPKS